MNLEILVSVDGQNYPLNDELHNTITSILDSYIKQKITGIVAKVKKGRTPKDPNAPKRPARPHLSDDEKQRIFMMARSLAPTMSMTRIAKEIATQTGRSANTVMSYIFRAKQKGELVFPMQGKQFSNDGGNN